MLGFEGVGVFLAYTLSIACAALCVAYGIINWNRPKEDEFAEAAEEAAWEKKDTEIEEGPLS